MSMRSSQVELYTRVCVFVCVSKIIKDLNRQPLITRINHPVTVSVLCVVTGTFTLCVCAYLRVCTCLLGAHSGQVERKRSGVSV